MEVVKDNDAQHPPQQQRLQQHEQQQQQQRQHQQQQQHHQHQQRQQGQQHRQPTFERSQGLRPSEMPPPAAPAGEVEGQTTTAGGYSRGGNGVTATPPATPPSSEMMSLLSMEEPMRAAAGGGVQRGSDADDDARRGFGATENIAVGDKNTGDSTASVWRDIAIGFPLEFSSLNGFTEPTAARERTTLEPGAGVPEPELVLDVVLAGPPRLLTRPTFYGREFVAFGAEASKKGVLSGQPRHSVAFAPLGGVKGAASVVWVDQAVSDVKWMSRTRVVVAAGSCLLLCGPPRPDEGVAEGSMSNVGSLPGEAIEFAVNTKRVGEVACSVDGGFVVTATVAEGGAGGGGPAKVVGKEDGFIGSVKWDVEDERCFSYTVDTGSVAYVDTRQPPGRPSSRMACFKGAYSHAYGGKAGIGVVAGVGGQVSFYDRRMGKSLSNLRDPVLHDIGDVHLHPPSGRAILFGHPGLTTWSVSRACSGAQGIAHTIFAAKCFPAGAPHDFEDRTYTDREGLCHGSLLTTAQDEEVLYGVVTAAPTSVVQIYKA